MQLLFLTAYFTLLFAAADASDNADGTPFNPAPRITTQNGVTELNHTIVLNNIEINELFSSTQYRVKLDPIFFEDVQFCVEGQRVGDDIMKIYITPNTNGKYLINGNKFNSKYPKHASSEEVAFNLNHGHAVEMINARASGTFEIPIMIRMKTREMQIPQDDGSAAYTACMMKFLEGDTGQDFEVKSVIDEGMAGLKAHKGILAAHSEYFAKRFTTKMNAGTEVSVAHLEFDMNTIHNALRYTYTRTVEDNFNAVKGFAISKYLAMSSYEKFCMRELTKRFDVDVAFELLEIDEDEATAMALEFMKSHPEMRKDGRINTLPPSVLLRIIRA